jgi:N-acetylglucosamine-6-phosphate deacetylase
MRTLITGGTLLTPERILEQHTLILEGGRIAGMQPDSPKEARSEDRHIDAGGLWVVPGFIDLHVHGGGGWDTMDATTEAARGQSRFLARHGVTAYLPTTISASGRAIRGVLDHAENIDHSLDGARPLGVHLEGPYYNPKFAGAQPRAALRKPDPAEYLAWFKSGRVRMISLAPELPGADRVIKAAVEHGVIPAAGHTEAGLETMRSAADLGLRQISHLFNAMPTLHHRDPGPVGAVLLDDRFIPHLIADGVHLHPAVIDLVVGIKGPDKTVLISDAMRAAGLEDGTYDLGGREVRVAAGVARTAQGALAGSTLTLDRALQYVVANCGLSLQKALPMITSTPAAVLEGSAERGSLRPGAAADVTLLDQKLEVVGTLVSGELVYRREDLPAPADLR